MLVPIKEGAVVFCHERTSPAGNRRLLMVLLPSTGGKDWVRGDILDEQLQVFVLPSISWHDPLPPWRGGMLSIPYSSRALVPPQRMYAGVPDPVDPSQFSIKYEWPDGVAGFLDGRLHDDDQVTFKVRPGPGDIESAFRRGLYER